MTEAARKKGNRKGYHDPLDSLFRALSRTSEGPFRVLAYGAVTKKEEEGKLSRTLSKLAREEFPLVEEEVTVEVASPFSSALLRPVFKREVLPRLKSDSCRTRRDREPLTGRGAPERAREELAELSAGLPDLLRHVDQTLEGNREPASEQPEGPSAGEGGNPPLEPQIVENEVPPPSEDLSEVAMLLCSRLEDLGGDAEGVARSLSAVLSRGAHVAILRDGVDTRTREGRAVTRALLRVGAIKAERAREEALSGAARRRAAGQIYGPVPYGFRRKEKALLPVEEELSIVRRIRELSKLGRSPYEVAAILSAEKRHWKDGSLFSWRRVKRIQDNSVYDQALKESPK